MLRWERRPFSQGESHARSPLCYERHHPRWQALHDRAGALLQGRRRGALSEALDAPDPRQTACHMGRLSDTSGKGGQGFSLERSLQRLKLEQLPGYAPDLNPDEGIWKHLKYVELK